MDVTTQKRSDGEAVATSARVRLPSVALSIRQPWTGVIVGGAKDVENRTWPTRFRGPVLLHAGKAAVDEDDWEYVREILRANRDRLKLGVCALAPDGSEWPRDKELPRGGIVGVAEIVDCVDNLNSPWFGGPWGFVLRNARPLPFFACKGALGFFHVEYPSALLRLSNNRTVASAADGDQ